MPLQRPQLSPSDIADSQLSRSLRGHLFPLLLSGTLPCIDAERAMERLRDESFELLFTNVCLPGLNGIALARRAVELRPGIRVVFASGYGDLAEHGGDAAQVFLRKPYNVTELLQALEEA